MNAVKKMSELIGKNQLLKPKTLPSLLLYGVQDDGQTIPRFNIQDHAKGAYLVLFFFPFGLKEDSEEVLKFAKVLKDLKECKVVGVTNKTPGVFMGWIRILKDHESNLKVLESDKDLASSISMGVARGCGWSSSKVSIRCGSKGIAGDR